MSPRVAVVGATGAVGREMLKILEERAFPVDELFPLASSRSAGRVVEFRGEPVKVQELTPESIGRADIALLSAGATVAREFVPTAAKAGVTCIDNSSAFREVDGVPLAIPEVNPESLEGSPKIIAVANCTTITSMMPLGPLHKAASLRELVLSSYQSVSGAGWKGVRELLDEVTKLQGSEEELGSPDISKLPTGEVFDKTIAYNVLAKIGDFEDDGYTGEESKMMSEPRKILSIPDLLVSATSVRVPVVRGHGVSISARFDRPIAPDEAREVLARAAGVTLMDDAAGGIYPSPMDSAGRDDAYVGRLRQGSNPNTLLLFSCCDNLRKGAALNAVQIAEYLFPA